MSYCGSFSHVSFVSGGLFKEMVQLSATQCNDIHKTNRFNYAGTEIMDLQSNTTRDIQVTEIGRVNADGSCQGVDIVRKGQSYKNVIILSTLTIILEDYQTVIDSQADQITFQDGTVCKASQGQCFTSSKGISFWQMDANNCDKNSQDILYEGLATISTTMVSNNTNELSLGDVVTVETQDKLLSLEIISSSHLCYQLVFKTDFKRISVIAKNSVFGFYFEKTSKILPNNIDLPMYLNAKFYYMARNFNNHIRNLHREVKYASCQASRDSILNKLRQARQQEISYSHILNNDEGYLTLASGDTLITIKCQPSLVDLRQADKCYKDLPVMHNDNSIFMETVGKTLVQTSEEIPCSKLAPAVFHVGKNLWVSAGKHMSFTEAPMKLKPNSYVQNLKFKDVKRYMVAGIYSNEQLETFSDFISHPMRVKSANAYITETIIKNQNHGENFQITNLLSPEELAKLKDNFLEEAERKLLRFGSIMGAITGIIVIIQIVRYIISTVINFKFLKSTLGNGLHLAAALFTSLTNFIVRNNVQNENAAEEIEVAKLNV